jgi:hypothetical protein
VALAALSDKYQRNVHPRSAKGRSNKMSAFITRLSKLSIELVKIFKQSLRRRKIKALKFGGSGFCLSIFNPYLLRNFSMFVLAHNEFELEYHMGVHN